MVNSYQLLPASAKVLDVLRESWPASPKQCIFSLPFNKKRSSGKKKRDQICCSTGFFESSLQILLLIAFSRRVFKPGESMYPEVEV